MRKIIFWILLVVATFVLPTCICNKLPELSSKPVHLCTMFGNVSSADSLLGESTLLWKKKQVQVYFFDDDGNMRDQVLNIANTWQAFSGIQFVKCLGPNVSDIRVSFRTNGWWSYIGSSCLKVGKDSVTLSLDSLYLYPQEKVKSVVLHEFGHSLGLLHEHQHPFLDIKWNLPALYDYYKKTYEVDSDWVQLNVLEKYRSLTGIYCEPDLNSIMIYEIPPELTLDHMIVAEPKELSPLDKKYIKYMYTNIPCK